ncbi:MAG TPA: hypothetical protein VHB79_29930 [Polyangiaceae bacterium]|nr:hypothetical protein [Polyangiaceae bacterium]
MRTLNLFRASRSETPLGISPAAAGDASSLPVQRVAGLGDAAKVFVSSSR